MLDEIVIKKLCKSNGEDNNYKKVLEMQGRSCYYKGRKIKNVLDLVKIHREENELLIEMIRKKTIGGK